LGRLTTTDPAPGAGSQQHERMAWLILAVGGQGAAARIAEVSADTINNLRKPGWKISLNVALSLCQEARVSLDWLATGHHVRPDLAATGAPVSIAGVPDNGAASHVRLLPLRPRHTIRAGASVEIWEPSSLAFEEAWLTDELGTLAENARYSFLDDDGMAPAMPRGSMVIVEPAPHRNLRSGLYLVELGDELLPRRLNRIPAGGFELVADADMAWRYPLPPEDPPPLFRILWSGVEQL
jgi:hypothetical protein